ncbi:phosphotransferase [Bacillus sp. 165]|uniref:phosphotransferase enzyme family protein n=1 Tax=Bacillus sp. 165 TaxID=1529117 RepID=UPI001AD99F07|nr:phosphotransferase [Bacillus sp. 165]MBO9129426.1 phosphotransferase [Bacillus sp. 165]
MSTVFPVMYSMLSSDALRDFVNENFDVGWVIQCKILHRGLNDTYVVVTEDSKYILRVYRTPWRSRAEVEYELGVLDFLSKHGVSVSVPIKNISGQMSSEINAPEGIRCVTLFTYAEGARPRLDANVSYEYGKTVAQIHNVTDGFNDSQDRFHLDFRHLIDEPLRVVTLSMIEYGGDIAYVQSWARTIRERVLIEEMDFGLCHGDCHDWNAHWSGSTLTVFDFDCCGPGYRAYDLAVYLWNLKTNYKDTETENWIAFLNGYRTLRPITETQIQSIPWFVAARRIWLAGIYLSNEDVWGTGMINEHFFRSFVDHLKEDERELGIKIETSL